MLYVDTSILVAFYCPESMSDQVEKVLLETSRPAISHLTEVELVSALSKKIREKALSTTEGNRIVRQFQSHLDENAYRLLPVEQKHFEMARQWIAQFNTPLRSLDALHLSLASASQLTLFTADTHLITSAERLGVEVLGVS